MNGTTSTFGTSPTTSFGGTPTTGSFGSAGGPTLGNIGGFQSTTPSSSVTPMTAPTLPAPSTGLGPAGTSPTVGGSTPLR